MGYFIPGAEIDDSRYREAEYGLEFPHSGGGCRSEDSIRRNVRDGAVDGGDGVQLFLHLLYLLAAGADG